MAETAEFSPPLPAEYRADCALVVGCGVEIQPGDTVIYIRIMGKESGAVLHEACARLVGVR